MGVFDFLYKSKPHQAPRSRDRAFASSAHNTQRTVLHVNRSNSVPNDQVQDQNNFQRQPNERSYNVKHRHNHNSRINGTTKNMVNYYKQSQAINHDDDFTRLSRVEKKVDTYIKRHNEIQDELDNIKFNLLEMFSQISEKSDKILNEGNKHTIEVLKRISQKLTPFMPNTPKKDKRIQNETGHNLLAEKQSLNRNSKENKQSPTEIFYNQNTVNNYRSDDFTFNLTGVNPSNIESNSDRVTTARAQYAIVNSTPYEPAHKTVRPYPDYYKSTPTLNDDSVDYGFEHRNDLPTSYRSSPQTNDATSSLYLNMSMNIHSDHPVIEKCFRRIEQLRPKILHYKSEHKLRVYKELDHDIIHLMNQLDAIDFNQDSLFQQDKNVALCELHNLSGVLERSIECHNPECVICNSLIYTQEVSV